MVSKAAVEAFLAQRKLAVVGISRQGKKFGNIAYKELKKKGYEVFPVHPQAEKIEGDRCYASLAQLSGQVNGVLIAVPPAQAEKVVLDAYQAGIRHVWLQQGAESEAAIRFCEENGINVIHGKCILMFAEPTAFFHRMHRWIWGALGKLPK